MKLTTNDIQQFYAKLQQGGRLLRTELYGEGLSDQTVRGIHTTLHAALDKAVAEKLLFRNPADGCRLPSAKAREMQVLAPEEIQRLLIQAKEDNCFELLLLELSTGLRRGEICALQWEDLNLRTGELRVERQVHRVKDKLVTSPPKTKAGNRSVILPVPVLDVLGAYKETVNSRWMFPSPVSEDSPRDPAAVRKRLQTVLERAECKKIRFHDLRHTFSTTALEHGMGVTAPPTVWAKSISMVRSWRETPPKHRSTSPSQPRPEISLPNTLWANCTWSAVIKRKPTTGLHSQPHGGMSTLNFSWTTGII